MKIFYLSVILSLILYIVSIFLLNETILRLNSPSILTSSVLLFNPPTDLYDSLVDEQIDVVNSKKKYNVSFKHKYSGKHNLEIFFSNFDSELYFKPFKFKIISKIDCYVDNVLRYSQTMNRGVPFISKLGGGYTILTYEVPNDFNLNDTVKCNLNFEYIDYEFLKKYGPAKIQIKKMSDL